MKLFRAAQAFSEPIPTRKYEIEKWLITDGEEKWSRFKVMRKMDIFEAVKLRTASDAQPNRNHIKSGTA